MLIAKSLARPSLNKLKRNKMDYKASKVDKTFNRVIAQLNDYTKVFRSGGMLEKAVAEMDGDIAWFNDIRDKLDDLIDTINDAHMYSMVNYEDVEGSNAVESTQLGESKQINEATGLLDSTDEDGFMTRSQLYFMARDAIQLHGLIGDRDEVEPWIQKKVSRAAEDVESIRQHVEYSKMATPDVSVAQEPQLPVPTEAPIEEGVRSSDGSVETVTTEHDDETTSFDVYHNGKPVGSGWLDLYADQMHFNDAWHDLSGYANVAEKLAEILNGVSESLEEGADLDDGNKALDPQKIAASMMKAAKAQAAKKVAK
jgi:hypothetical protein